MDGDGVSQSPPVELAGGGLDAADGGHLAVHVEAVVARQRDGRLGQLVQAVSNKRALARGRGEMGSNESINHRSSSGFQTPCPPPPPNTTDLDVEGGLVGDAAHTHATGALTARGTTHRKKHKMSNLARV